MQQAPKYLFVGLRFPAIHLGWNEWDMTKRAFINGKEVEGNDTPWNAVVADLLISSDERTLVGASFTITKPQFFEPMQRLAKRLDKRVVRYADREQGSQHPLSSESGSVPSFEIFWCSGERFHLKPAQILCGQWFWWYALTPEELGEWPVIAFGLGDLDELVTEHELTLPDFDLPPLDVQFK